MHVAANKRLQRIGQQQQTISRALSFPSLELNVEIGIREPRSGGKETLPILAVPSSHSVHMVVSAPCTSGGGQISTRIGTRVVV